MFSLNCSSVVLFCGSGDRAGVHLVLAAVPREPDAVFRSRTPASACITSVSTSTWCLWCCFTSAPLSILCCITSCPARYRANVLAMLPADGGLHGRAASQGPHIPAHRLALQHTLLTVLCVCVCEREREWCACERERERECVCVCVRERACVCVCV